MSLEDAQNAIMARVQTMPGRPAIAYPNGPLVSELPRIVLDIPPGASSTFGGDGSTLSIAEVLARVETEDGIFDASAVNIVKQIKARFRPGYHEAAFQIRTEPSVRARYAVGGVYHIPVIIRAEIVF